MSEPAHDDPVTAARAALDGVNERPLDEQLAAYEQAHARLQEALADVGDD